VPSTTTLTLKINNRGCALAQWQRQRVGVHLNYLKLVEEMNICTTLFFLTLTRIIKLIDKTAEVTVDKVLVSSTALRSRVAFTILSLILGVGIIVAPASRADSLDVLGGIVSWPDKMYLPDGCSNFSFQYKNNSGVRLLQLGFILSDPYGRKLEDASQIGIDPGKSGTWNQQMCSWDFKNGTGPYVMKVYLEDYSSIQREVTKEIFFSAIPGNATSPSSGLSPAPTVTVTATPAPAPTVYVTNPSDENLTDLVTSLKSQLRLLNAKVKRICSVKPKPKGC